LHVGHPNEGFVCDTNDANGDKSIITEQLATSIPQEPLGTAITNNDNIITSNNVNNGGNSDHNLMSAEQTPMNKGHQPTYAEVTASPPVSHKTQFTEKLETNYKPQHFSQTSQSKINELPSISADGFTGVDRRRNTVKKFLLSRIAENVKECQIVSYLKQQNITPTYISVFPSKRKGHQLKSIFVQPIVR
jgi:hypothetical protein